MYLYDTYISLNKKNDILLNIDIQKSYKYIKGFRKASLLATLSEQEMIIEESIKSQVVRI